MPYTNKNVHDATALITMEPFPEDYNSFFKVSDYPSVKEAVTEAVKHQDSLGDYGITYIFFDRFDDIMLMPTHHTNYFINKEECTYWEWECSNEDNIEIVHSVEHHVDWTEDLNMHNHLRIVTIYCPEDKGVEEEIENARLLLTDSQVTPCKFKITSSKARDYLFKRNING